MLLDWLAVALRAEGCTVEEHTGWETRTMKPETQFTPVALIDHHTAGSKVIPNYPNKPYYSNVALQSKCNLTIRPDGVVVCLNAGWAFDSGYGDRLVLNAVEADRVLPDPSDTYKSLDPLVPGGPNPARLGNAWFIDIEVQHLGNGDPIVPVQREALIRSNVAICRQMNWDPRTRVIGHREWTVRKGDPRWNGNANPMPEIRADTYAMLNPQEDFDMLPLKKGETREDVRLLQIKLNKGYGLKLALTAVYDDPTVAAVKTHLGGFTGSPVGQKGEEVVATMWQALDDAVDAKRASAIDATARANAAAAHQRLDKLHTV
jgi:hypothetical protein